MILTLILATLRWILTAWFVDNVAILLFAQCLHAATFGIYHAVAIQYIHKEFKGMHQGRGQALYSSVSFGAGIALGSLISGYLWDSVGSMQTFLFAAILSALGVIVAWFGLKD
jgi:PPP family 3-phenylpropionic acid transporter